MGLRLSVTVESPSGRTTVSVPQKAVVADLLPGLVKACEGRDDASGWLLSPLGEAPLDGTQSLAGAGLYSGAVLRLIPPPPSEAAPPPRARPAPAPRIDAMGEWDYRRTLDRAIAGGSQTGNVIAVVGSQAGVGTTTVAALLATLLAELRPQRIACVDANPPSGALSQWLAPDTALPAGVYRSLFEQRVMPQTVEGALVSAGPRLSVLPGPLDPTVGSGDAAAWKRVLEHLRRIRHAVVIDCGAGAQRDAVVAGLEFADHIVFVNKPGADKAPPKSSKPVVMVTNLSQRRTRMHRSGGVPQITIPVDQHAAVLLKRRGFDWETAPNTWQEAVRELAAVLVAAGPPAP